MNYPMFFPSEEWTPMLYDNPIGLFGALEKIVVLLKFSEDANISLLLHNYKTKISLSGSHIEVWTLDKGLNNNTHPYVVIY